MNSAAPGCRANREPSAPAKARAAGQISTIVPGAQWLRPPGTSRLADRAFGTVDKDQVILGIERHHPLRPAAGSADELPDRQRVEELVGHHQHRAVRQLFDTPHPCRLRLAEASFLFRAKHRARLDQTDAQGAAKFRHSAGGAQQVAHQHAAAGPQLCQDYRIRPADPLPQLGAPQPDQFAENLADLGRGREIARRSDRAAPRIVPALGVVQRHGHIGRNSQRALGANPPDDLVGDFLAHDRAGTGARSAQAMIRTPAISKGIDNS